MCRLRLHMLVKFPTSPRVGSNKQSLESSTARSVSSLKLGPIGDRKDATRAACEALGQGAGALARPERRGGGKTVPSQSFGLWGRPESRWKMGNRDADIRAVRVRAHA